MKPDHYKRDFHKNPGTDFSEINTPAMDYTSQRTNSAILAQNILYVSQLDYDQLFKSVNSKKNYIENNRKIHFELKNKTCFFGFVRHYLDFEKLQEHGT